MHSGEWVDGPFGVDAVKGATVSVQRTVLAVVHSVVTAARLADVLPALASDWRIQVVFTTAPSLFPGGVQEFLQDMGAFVIPWEQAVRERFDLAIAAATGQLERLHAPVVLMPHGVGYAKYPARWDGYGLPAPSHAHGTERQQLVYHGRVVPSVILLAHPGRLAQLRQACPEAAPAAVIAGDPLVASLPMRDSYRRALGVRDDQRLVLVTSTWGTRSLLGEAPETISRLMADLPADRYRLTASLHPDTWYWHSPWQVKMWTDGCRRAGMTFLPAAEGWRGALVAADLVIGDHGSVAFYAAALGVPVLLAAFPGQDVAPGSHVASLGKIAPRLESGRPLLPQVEQAIAAHRPERYARVRGEVSAAPGQARQIIRGVVYRQLGLPEPDGVPELLPVPLPHALTGLPGTLAACSGVVLAPRLADSHPGYPSTGPAEPSDQVMF
jgi:hypothetical protein